MGARQETGTGKQAPGNRTQENGAKLTRYERYMFNTITPIHG